MACLVVRRFKKKPLLSPESLGQFEPILTQYTLMALVLLFEE